MVPPGADSATPPTAEIQADAYFSILPEWLIDAPVSDRAVRLYAVLARYANGSRECWPSRARLAERLRCSVDSLDRALAELTDPGLGAVEVTRRRDRTGAPLSNLYTVRTGLGSRTGAATPSRTPAAGVAAPVPPELKPVNQSQKINPSPPADAGVLPESCPTCAVSGDDHCHTASGRDHPARNRPVARVVDGMHIDAAFHAWWQVFPRKVGKIDARKAYVAALKKGATSAELLAAARLYAADPNRREQFTVHPGTWLRQGRWMDESPLPANAPERVGPDERVQAGLDLARRLAENGDRNRLAP